MNFKQSFLSLALIGLVQAHANGAIAMGVDGNGPFKSAIPTPAQTLKLSLGGNYADAKGIGVDQVWSTADQSDLTAALSGNFKRTDLNFAANYGILPWLEASLFAPYYMDQTPNGSKSALGDLVLGLKLNYPPYGEPGKRAYELSYLGQIVVPGASASNTTEDGLPRNAWNVRSSNGQDTLVNPYHAVEPVVVMSLLNTINFKAIKGSVPLLLHYNAGLAMGTGTNRQRTTVLGELGMEFWPGAIGIFAAGGTEVPTSYAEKGVPFQKFPASLKGGLMAKIPTDRLSMEFTLGASKSINTKPLNDYFVAPTGGTYGYAISRQANLAFFGGLTIGLDFAARDTDHDGVLDAQDRCENTPDGVSTDSEGCPVPDGDKDGICDAWVSAKGMLNQFAGLCSGIDKCPVEAEDMDKTSDEDGCPDPDNDGDKLCDPWVAEKGLNTNFAQICSATDKCPDEAEDMDGFEDEDGCPDLDNDKDGITDNLDQCPNEAEDKDGFQDGDGCPDPDNDRDGITDNLDKCPNKQGKASNNGCP